MADAKITELTELNATDSSDVLAIADVSAGETKKIQRGNLAPLEKVGTALQVVGSGGNARGANAVDLQATRGVATQVASGVQSTIGGGGENTASGQYATVGGGSSNQGFGSGSTVGGGFTNSAGAAESTIGGGSANNINDFATQATISGGASNIINGSATQATIGGGISNTATGEMSTICGGSVNQANGTRTTIGGGTGNSADGLWSTIGGGLNNVAGEQFTTVVGGSYANPLLYGQEAYAAGQFAAGGDAQRSTLVARRQTTNATAAVLFLDGTAIPLAILSNKTWQFLISIVARKSDGVSAAYVRQGCIKNVGGTTALVGGVSTIGVDCVDTGAATWAVAVSADNTNDTLKIEVTGAAASTIRWVARIELTEVGH